MSTQKKKKKSRTRFLCCNVQPSLTTFFVEILVKTVLEYMEGGEVRWKDEDDRPILAIDMARSIFRDVVLGLEYRK